METIEKKKKLLNIFVCLAIIYLKRNIIIIINIRWNRH